MIYIRGRHLNSHYVLVIFNDNSCYTITYKVNIGKSGLAFIVVENLREDIALAMYLYFRYAVLGNMKNNQL